MSAALAAVRPRRTKANPAPCYHCGGNGWDHYMICQEIWDQVTPPDVDSAKYASGFVCFRCCLQRTPRKLYREDFGETPVITWADGDCEAQLWFPRRSDKRSHVTLEFHVVGEHGNAALVDALLTEQAELLDLLAQHYTRVYCTNANYDRAEAKYPYADGGAGRRWGNIKL